MFKKLMYSVNMVLAFLSLTWSSVGVTIIVSEGYQGNLIPQDFYTATLVVIVFGLFTLCNSLCLKDKLCSIQN